MAKRKIWVVAAALTAGSIFGLMPSAQAATCDDLIEGDTDRQACAAAAKVICGVLNKGRPCLD